MNVVLKSDYYKYLSGYDNIVRYVNEIIKLQRKIAFFFENTIKVNIVTQEDKEGFDNNNFCRFCENEILSDEVRDHCHLTNIYRGPAHSNRNNNVTQKQSNFIAFVFHNFINYDCHHLFEKLVDKKMIY